VWHGLEAGETSPTAKHQHAMTSVAYAALTMAMQYGRQLQPAALQAVDACAMGQGTAAQLLQVWRELRVSIETWLQARDQPSSATLQESRVHASAMWAVQAMQDAISLGDDALVQVSILSSGSRCRAARCTVCRCLRACQRARLSLITNRPAWRSKLRHDELLVLTCMSCTQVPLEAILNYDSDSLHAIKALIDKQQRSMTDRLPSIYSQADVTDDGDIRDSVVRNADAKPVTRSKMLDDAMSSAVESTDHFACHDDFDSSAETEQEEGSQVTDMSESD